MKTKFTSVCVALCLALPVTVGLLSGCAGSADSRSTGQYVDDKSLDYRVKHALHENQEYKFDDVNVTSYKGTVQLSGFVDTEDQKSQAEEIAKKVPGAESVQNNISIKQSHASNM